jgi:hypothetical protein
MNLEPNLEEVRWTLFVLRTLIELVVLYLEFK